MEQRKIWSHFQNRRPNVFDQAQSRHRFLVRRLPPGRILNIGIGSGGLEVMGAAARRAMYSLDPDHEAVAHAVALGITHAATGSIEAIPFCDASFDAVVCSEVLEHLSDDILQPGLREIRRVLRPGGELHGTVPADENLLESETVCLCCGAVFHRWGHEQSFSQERLQSLLQTVGAAKVERRLFVHWPGLNWQSRMAAYLRLTLAACGMFGSPHVFYFVVRKHG